MIKSNLIELISKLNPREFKELGEYVRSPFFNKNQSVIALYDYISIQYPDFDERNMEKETVYKKLFPGGDYNNGFMKTMMFNLSKLTEDYLGYLNYSGDSVERKIHLVKELYNRNAEGLFRKKIREADKELEEKYHDAEYHRNKYDIKCIEAMFESVKKNYFSEKKTMDNFFQGNTRYLLNYFLIEALEDYRTLMNLSRVLNYKYDYSEVNTLIEFIKRNPALLDNTLVKLHYYEVMLLKESDEVYYYKLKEIFLKEMKNLGQINNFGALTVLLNFTYFQYFSGKSEFMKERFELSKLRIEEKLFAKSDEGLFGPDVFEGTFNAAIAMKEYKWSSKFIEDYKGHLPAEHRDNIINYSYAKLNFHLGDLDKSAAFLSKVPTPQYVNLKYKVKILNMMILYEKELFDSAYDAVDAFRHFIAKDKILHELRKELYSNFLKFYNELLKLKAKSKPKNAEKIQAELNKTLVTIEREWLMEKLKNLQLNAK